MAKRLSVVLILAVAVLIGGLQIGSRLQRVASAESAPPTFSPWNRDDGTPVVMNEELQASKPVFNAYKRFAFKFYGQCVEQDPGASIFVSPLSISTCLSMVYNGASGETRDAMAKTLELEGISLEDLNTGTANLAASLMGDGGKGSWFELAIANSLWANKNAEFRQDYMDRVTSAYSAKLTTLDFGDPQTIPTINDWVKQQTRGRIDSIIDRINPEDVLLLVNSVYFKGKWLDEFDKKETKDRKFYLPGGRTKMHPMMRREDDFLYYKGQDFQAVSVPYGYGPLSMYVFLPNMSSDLDRFHKSLTAENWDKWMSEFKLVPGELIMPRFKLRYEPDLDAALKALGMEIAFTRGKADFTGMTPDPPGVVWLDRTKHKTYVDVNEEGTEAAAVTSAMMAAGIAIGPESEPFTMQVDRPFFVAIRDSRSGTLLFMGSITDPQE